MSTKELVFLDCLIRTTDGSNIVVLPEDGEGITLSLYFNVGGKYADGVPKAGIYVYEDADWEILGDFTPNVVYNLADSEQKLFYFYPQF